MRRLSRCLVAIMALALCYLAPVSFVSPSPRVAPMEAPRARRVTESLGNSMPSSFSCGVLLMTAAVAGAGGLHRVSTAWRQGVEAFKMLEVNRK